jgi:Pro-kumamolisin, activation domain
MFPGGGRLASLWFLRRNHLNERKSTKCRTEKIFPDSVIPVLTSVVTLHGMIVNAAEQSHRAEQMDISFSLALPPTIQKELEERVDHGDVSSPEEMQKKYSADAPTADALQAWLKSEGFTITEVTPDRTTIYARASVSQINDPSKPTLPPNASPPANAVQNHDTGQLMIAIDKSVTPDKWAQLGFNPLDKQLHAVTEAVNQQVQARPAADHNSVFQYYELVDAQWPVHPNALGRAGGAGSAPESIRYKTPGEMVPVFLVNTTMETYFQKGSQPAGSLEQDDRLVPTAPPIDATTVNGTESCVGCHYSSGITIGFEPDLKTGKEYVDKNGAPTTVFGENNHLGKTGNASFSWMLQLEPKAKLVDIHDPGVTTQCGGN